MNIDEELLRRRDFARRAALGVSGLVATGLAGEHLSVEPLRTGGSSGAFGPMTVTVKGDDATRSSRAAAVQSAIEEARECGLDFVLVPSNFGPGVDGYDASAVAFDPDIRMLREGNVGDVYDVKAYGAAADYDPRTDTGTDDTAAINATADQIRALAAGRHFLGNAGRRNPHHEVGAALYIPQGLYRCDGDIWLGADAAGGNDYDNGVKNVHADPGAVLVSRNTDGIAVDATGAFNLRISNLTIWGDRRHTPQVGLLLARSGTSTSPTPPSSGNHKLQNVKICGNYAVSAVYNYASELNRWVNCELRNASPRGRSTIYVTRDNATEAVTSDRTVVNTSQGYSNYSPRFVNTDIRFDVEDDGTRAAVVVESGTWGPKFYNCYFDLLQGARTSPPIIRVRSGGSESGISARTQGLSLQGCTFENDYDAIVRVEGDLRAFHMEDCHLAGSRAETADIVVAPDAHLRAPVLQTYRGGSHVARLTTKISGTFKQWKNRGIATVEDGSTAVRVVHGMDGSEMTLGDIAVTPTNDLGNATTFWVENLDDTSFVIRVDKDPGPNSARFSWNGEIH